MIPELLLFPRTGNLQGFMPWGQRPACKGAHLKMGQRLQEVSGWEAMGFTDSARGNIGQDSQKGPETVTEMHP